MTDIEGKQYINGLSCLWNVKVGAQDMFLAQVPVMGWMDCPRGTSTWNKIEHRLLCVLQPEPARILEWTYTIIPTFHAA